MYAVTRQLAVAEFLREPKRFMSGQLASCRWTSETIDNSNIKNQYHHGWTLCHVQYTQSSKPLRYVATGLVQLILVPSSNCKCSY